MPEKLVGEGVPSSTIQGGALRDLVQRGLDVDASLARSRAWPKLSPMEGGLIWRRLLRLGMARNL